MKRGWSSILRVLQHPPGLQMDPTPSAPTIDATGTGIEGGEFEVASTSSFESHVGICKAKSWGTIYKPIWKVFQPLQPAYRPKAVAQPSGLCFPEPSASGGDEASIEDGTVKSIRVFRNKRASAALSWDGLLNTQRIAAIRKWVGIISASPLCFDLGRRWNRLDPLGASLAEGLKNVFADKATGTLHARAGALLRLVAWCHKSGLVPFPLREETVYQFMQSSTGTAPTFLRSLLVSLRFAHFVLGLTGADDVVTSHRVIGCAKLAYLQKRRLVQKEPLTVAMVAAMEAYVCDKRQPARERYVIGCFLICTFMRARFSDMMNLVDFTADSIDFGDLPGGYVEAKVTRTKSAYTLERKTMYLPMTAPRCGVSGLDWYEGWQHAKLVAAVPHGPGMPLFPALTNQGWSRVPATAGAAADWLRKILLIMGFPGAKVQCIGTHSCKATTLSWMSKFGEALEIRSQLGYHTTRNSALIYSRDAMAGPIRRLQFVLEQIRLSRFKPDMTRSGYFPGAASGETEDITDDNTTDSPESSDSEDSADEEDDAEDKTLIEKAADAELDAWSEHATIESLALDTPPSLFRNASTRYIHIVADESGARFRCGREVTTSYQQLSEVPKFCTPQCRQCFR